MRKGQRFTQFSSQHRRGCTSFIRRWTRPPTVLKRGRFYCHFSIPTWMRRRISSRYLVSFQSPSCVSSSLVNWNGPYKLLGWQEMECYSRRLKKKKRCSSRYNRYAHWIYLGFRFPIKKNLVCWVRSTECFRTLSRVTKTDWAIAKNANRDTNFQ